LLERDAPHSSSTGDAENTAFSDERKRTVATDAASILDQEPNAVEEDWSKYPILFCLATDLLQWMRMSPRSRYEEDEVHTQTIWRSLTYDRKIGKQGRATPEYAEYYRCYFQRIELYHGSSYDEKIQRMVDIQQKLLAMPTVSGLLLSDDAMRDMLQRYLRAESDYTDLFDRAARRFCYQLRATITRTKFVAMVPHAAKKGDILVVIKGVSVPMIFRPVAIDEAASTEETKRDEGSVSDNRFKVARQAYAYGHMDGEISEISGYESETVVLV
jgi:hypothetical protein